MNASAASGSGEHAALMDSIYGSQRHIYDLTRKYYLFGRDRTIRELDLAKGGAVLELGCGTGRNLIAIRRHWPKARLFGIDISAEMLKSAGKALGGDADLARGDATDFDPAALFGQEQFDRVMISFAVSMIPAWEAALERAATVLSPGGMLHVVDFGTMERFPAPLRKGLLAWLARFHVTPRPDLLQVAEAVADRQNLIPRSHIGPGGYYQQVTLHRPA